jgi:hypothetical protein
MIVRPPISPGGVSVANPRFSTSASNEIVWTATIDADQNADTTNDTVQAVTRQCRS